MITQCPKTGRTCELTGCNGCWKVEQAEHEQYPTYGFCPICGSRGISRERRIDGNDTCANGHSYASNLALHIAPEKQAEQEPVAFIGQGLKPIVPEDLEKLRKHEPGTATLYDTSLYAAPVRTKDLTDDEIWKELVAIQASSIKRSWLSFARAVIAKDREKNK